MFTPDNRKFAALSNLRRFRDFYPSQQNDSVTFSIRRHFTNTAGTIVSKGSVAPALQTEYPVYLFATFDRDGGYKVGNELFPAINATLVYADKFDAFSLLSFTGVNNVKNELKSGDFVLIFTDDTTFPNTFIWIVISGDVTSYASLLNNPIEGGLLTQNIKYKADNQIQFDQKIGIVNIDTLGYYEVDYLDPQMYKTADYQQDDFINMNLKYNINNYSGLYFYMDFDCDLITFFIRYQNIINRNRSKKFNSN